MAGEFIDHQSPHSYYPSSLLYTYDLMGWHSLDGLFQKMVNQVFDGSMTAQEFKEESASILSVKIAYEILED
jgi:hypothetical protein